ncbi:hypothetical protein Tco_1127904, partial [Tanacetum coccineum]
MIAPPTRHAEGLVDSDMPGARSTPSDSTAPLPPDHSLPLLHPPWFPFSIGPSSYESSPSSSPPDLPSRKHYWGTSKLVDDDDKEEDDDEEEDEEVEERDEGLAAGDEGTDMRVESLSLRGDEAVLEGQQWAASVVKIAM